MISRDHFLTKVCLDVSKLMKKKKQKRLVDLASDDAIDEPEPRFIYDAALNVSDMRLIVNVFV